MQDCLEDRFNAVDLIQKMNTLELMERAFLTEQEKELIPLTVLVSKKKELEKQTLQINFENIEDHQPEASRQQRLRQLQRGKSTKKYENKKQPSRTEIGSGVFLEEEFEELLASQASNEMSEQVKEYMIKNLSRIYMREAQSQNRKRQRKEQKHPNQLFYNSHEEQNKQSGLRFDQEDPDIKIMGKIHILPKEISKDQPSPITPATMTSQGSPGLIKSTDPNEYTQDQTRSRTNSVHRQPSKFKPREGITKTEM